MSRPSSRPMPTSAKPKCIELPMPAVRYCCRAERAHDDRVDHAHGHPAELGQDLLPAPPTARVGFSLGADHPRSYRDRMFERWFKNRTAVRLWAGRSRARGGRSARRTASARAAARTPPRSGASPTPAVRDIAVATDLSPANRITEGPDPLLLSGPRAGPDAGRRGAGAVRHGPADQLVVVTTHVLTLLDEVEGAHRACRWKRCPRPCATALLRRARLLRSARCGG